MTRRSLKSPNPEDIALGVRETPPLSEAAGAGHPDDQPQLAERGRVLARLAQRLSEGRALKQRQSVILIDIDNMRDINETWGYRHGAQLLAELNKRLRAAVAGKAELCRIGEDEFVVIPQQAFATVLESTASATALASDLLDTLQQPVAVGRLVNWMTASLGIAVAKGGPTAERLFQEADIALSRAKADDGNQIRVFVPQMRALAKDRNRLDADLRAAIRDKEFVFFTQPQVMVRDDIVTVTGYELLVRWKHPHRGMLSPAHFICHAEETGLIRKIDMWMIEQACLLLAAWAGNSERADLRLSVNVSTSHFRDPEFAGRIAEIIKRTGAPAKRLTLEITETMILDNVQIAKGTMLRLRRMGVSFSLDDFGTGFSSMNLIHHLPFSEIKIDQSFVSGLPKDFRASEIVANMIRLSRALGLDVIAEGVETHAQMDWLLGNKCCAAQGYLFGRPTPVTV